MRSVIGLDAVQSALEDDLNTPKAVAELHKLVSEFNRASNSNEKVKIKGAILAAGKLLGLLQINPEDWFKRVAGDIDDAKIEDLIRRRAEARSAKNFVKADSIRDKLAAVGIVLEDNAGLTTWKRT